MTKKFTIVHHDGPVDGLVQEFEGDYVPTGEWSMGKNGQWEQGVYRRKDDEPIRDDTIDFYWEPTDG